MNTKTLSAAIGLVFLIAAVPPADAQTSRAVISTAAFEQDIALLQRAFETLHPGVYRYQTMAEVNKGFDDMRAAARRGLTVEDAYVTLARFLNTVQCGHTFPNPANQSDALLETVITSKPRLPFYFRWLDGRMVVTRDLSGTAALAAGTEIVSIDGKRTQEILSKLLPLSRADGGNDIKRIANLELQGRARFEAFDVYYPLLYELAAETELTIRQPGGEQTRTVRIATMTNAARSKVRDADAAALKSASSAGWTFEVEDASMGLLRMPTWVTYNDDWDWKGFIHRSFDQLIDSGAKSLVIDLRGNEGGTGVGDVILSRIIASDLPLASFERWVRYDTVPGDLRPHLTTWDKSFFDWSAHLGEKRNGFMRMTRYDDKGGISVIKPAGRRFAGRVIVLVDANNSSATFEFAQMIQANRLGTLIGEPTGGNKRGINGGAFFFLRLPNSGIEVDLPLIGYYPQGFETDALENGGLVPDIHVPVTAASIAQGRDLAMEAVRNGVD